MLSSVGGPFHGLEDGGQPDVEEFDALHARVPCLRQHQIAVPEGVCRHCGGCSGKCSHVRYVCTVCAANGIICSSAAMSRESYLIRT
jgi:hypothetical protein